MNYLLSGVTSFTGIHLLTHLLDTNNKVICLTSKDIEDISIKRYKKINSIRKKAKDRLDFIKVDYTEDIDIEKINCDIDCFISHGYFVNNYKDQDQSPFSIAEKSTIWMRELKRQLDKRNCKSIAVTGTYFSNFKNSLQTPYSVSKTIAWEYIKFMFKQYNMLYYLFPNPYGIHESQKLSYHFINSMINNKDFELSDPYSIRDNIPVQFLIDDYCMNISEMPKKDDRYENITIKSPSYAQQSNIEYLKNIMNNFLKIRDTKTKILLPNTAPAPSTVTGKEQIRDKYIEQEEKIMEEYIMSYIIE